jgi:hypothetical protein
VAAGPDAARATTAAGGAWRDLPVLRFVPLDAEPALPAIEAPMPAIEPAEPWDDARFSLFGDLER